LKAEYIDDPKEMLGRRLDFQIHIYHAVLPEDKFCCKDTSCEYTLMINEKEPKSFRTDVVSYLKFQKLY
jgi:hypothetical protein